MLSGGGACVDLGGAVDLLQDRAAARGIPPTFGFGHVAERAGFEPALGDYPKHAFQACDLNRSSTSPGGGKLKLIARLRQARGAIAVPSGLARACRARAILRGGRVRRRLS